MSRKRFTTMVAVVLILGGAGLFCLYMTLGKMSQVLRQQGHVAGASAAESSSEKIQELTLTPAGESQLREEERKAREAQQRAPRTRQKEDAVPPPPEEMGAADATSGSESPAAPPPKKRTRTDATKSSGR